MNAWLDPNGKIIEVPGAFHDEYAYILLKKEAEMDEERVFDLIEKEKCEYPYQVLHKRGWVRIKSSIKGQIRILGDSISLVKPMRNTIDPAMNRKQIKVAKEICRNNNTSFHEAINDKMLW